MTDQPAAPAESAPPAAPVLVHSGVYTLWETPGGGRLLAYKRLTTTYEGQVVDIPEPQDERLPHIPAEALPLVSQFLDNGIPPQVLQLLTGGKGSRLAALRNLAGLLGQLGADAAIEVPAAQDLAAERDQLAAYAEQDQAADAGDDNVSAG
jgi:hypothetical protein